jgi:hypothetical protein
VTDAAETVAACANKRGQHRLDTTPQRQIRLPNDARRYSTLAAITARAHGRDSIGELDLADRAHLDRTSVAVHRTRLHENRRNNVMAAAEIGQQLIQQIAPPGPIVQMVMWIDNRQLRL